MIDAYEHHESMPALQFFLKARALVDLILIVLIVLRHVNTYDIVSLVSLMKLKTSLMN